MGGEHLFGHATGGDTMPDFFSAPSPIHRSCRRTRLLQSCTRLGVTGDPPTGIAARTPGFRGGGVPMAMPDLNGRR